MLAVTLVPEQEFDKIQDASGQSCLPGKFLLTPRNLLVTPVSDTEDQH